MDECSRCGKRYKMDEDDPSDMCARCERDLGDTIGRLVSNEEAKARGCE
jgi:hypothetical protein